MPSKVCRKFGVEQEIENFGKAKSNKDGHEWVCRACHKEYKRRHYEEHKKEIKEKKKLYYQSNRERLDELHNKNREEISNKTCSKCHIEKPTEEFNSAKNNGDGLNKTCRSCEKVYMKNYTTKHKKELLEKKKLYYKSDPEKFKKRWKEQSNKNKERYSIRNKKYYADHREKRKEYNRQWNKNHKEEVKSQKKEYTAKNIEKIKKRMKIYVATRKKDDVNFNIAIKLRQRFLRAIKMGSKKTSVINLLGCTIQELKDKLKAQFTEGMTWDLFMQGDIHIDHIIPCSSFNLEDLEQQKLCFHYSNLQLLWKEHNLKKSDHILTEAEMQVLINSPRSNPAFKIQENKLAS